MNPVLLHRLYRTVCLADRKNLPDLPLFHQTDTIWEKMKKEKINFKLFSAFIGILSQVSNVMSFRDQLDSEGSGEKL